MDIFHILFFAVLVVAVFFLSRERKERKKAELWHSSANNRANRLEQDLETIAKAWLLSVLPAEKISYRPAEERFALNFVYPPPAPEMLVARNLNERERAIMDQIDWFLGGELRVGENFSWFQIPGKVTDEEKIRYSSNR